MKKEIHKNRLQVYYVPERKGAQYTLDFKHFMNAGQYKQMARIYALFNKIERPDKVPYNMGSDIPELLESVKSHKATLTSVKLGTTKKEILEKFFNTVASKQFSWVRIIDDEIITYIMTAMEFQEFCELFGEFEAERQVIRFREKKAMITWLESNF